MASRLMTNDEHIDRIERYLTLLLQGGRQEERRLKRKRETDAKFAILIEGRTNGKSGVNLPKVKKTPKRHSLTH